MRNLFSLNTEFLSGYVFNWRVSPYKEKFSPLQGVSDTTSLWILIISGYTNLHEMKKDLSRVSRQSYNNIFQNFHFCLTSESRRSLKHFLKKRFVGTWNWNKTALNTSIAFTIWLIWDWAIVFPGLDEWTWKTGYIFPLSCICFGSGTESYLLVDCGIKDAYYLAWTNAVL